MAKLVIKIVVALVVLIIGYNYFWGDAKEKETSRRIVEQVTELGKSVAELLQSEKENFDQGKYDSAIGQLKSALNIAKVRAAELGDAGHACREKCEHLEKEELELEEKLRSVDSDEGLSAADREVAHQAIRIQILKLTRETEDLAREIDG
jgi:hypothetical protein